MTGVRWLNPAPHEARMVASERGCVRVIDLQSVSWVGAEGDYVRFHQPNRSLLLRKTMAAAERELASRRFLRIHRSAIVNLERIARIEPYGKESRVAILTDGARLPVSRSGYARLLEAMGDSRGSAT